MELRAEFDNASELWVRNTWQMRVINGSVKEFLLYLGNGPLFGWLKYVAYMIGFEFLKTSVWE